MPNFFIALSSAEKIKESFIGSGIEIVESIGKQTQNAIIEMEYGVRDRNVDRFKVVNNTHTMVCLLSLATSLL